MNLKNDKKLIEKKLKIHTHNERNNLSLSSNIIFTSNNIFINNKKKQINNAITNNSNTKITLDNNNTKENIILVNKSITLKNSNINDNNNILNTSINDLNTSKKTENIEKSNKKCPLIYDIENYYPCYLCEKFYKDNYFYKYIKCEHKFCRECGKAFYEEKIEEGIYNNFKCGVYYCNCLIDDILIKLLVSPIHLKLLNKKNSNENNNNKNNHQILNIYSNFNNDEKFMTYINNNIIDVNSNELFFNYCINKNNICLECKKNTLYGKNSSCYVKCLNCFKKYCKFCFKKYDIFHFDIKSKNRCKVYFRQDNIIFQKYISNYQKKYKNKFKDFCYLFFKNILLLIGIFMLINSFLFIELYIKIRYKKKSFIEIISIIFYLLLGIFLFCFSFLLIPYLPIISCI